MVRKGTSLAQQAADEILSGIHSGKLAASNGALPSEAELTQRFGVSRATIREALAKLEHARVIVRKHGVGTFVAPPTPVIDAGLEELESIETLAQRIGLETRMGKLTMVERAPSPVEADRLQITSEERVWSIARPIMASKRPVAYLIDIVPMAYLDRADLGEDFHGSVLDLFLQKAQVELSHSRTNISPEAAGETIARQLRLDPGETLLKLEAQLYARSGQVVDYSISYFVPGYFHFHVVRRIGQNKR